MPVPLMNQEGYDQRSSNADTSGDEWYWYFQFPIGTLLLLWAAGLFGRGGAGDVHVKPNVELCGARADLKSAE
nr:hypothetical protein [uncultured Undibacterium sp.]